MSHVTCHMSYVKCLYWSLGHAEQLLFSCLMSHDTCHILPFTCHMLYVKCLCWSFGHAEQLLFSCVSSKVSICNYVTCHMSYVKCLCWSLWHAKQFLFSSVCSNVAVYGWKCQWFFFWPHHPCLLANQS